MRPKRTSRRLRAGPPLPYDPGSLYEEFCASIAKAAQTGKQIGKSAFHFLLHVVLPVVASHGCAMLQRRDQPASDAYIPGRDGFAHKSGEP